ncbi:universal stress protein [Francisellaceae bacterium]|nr:universal stress protein [Francisellaceae bacterium]
MDIQDILVPINLHEEHTKVIDSAIDLADKYNSNLTILNVQAAPFELSGLANEQDKSLENRIKNDLNEKSKNTNIKQTKVETVMGVAQNEIVSYAKKHKTDLIVMGTHNKHGVSLLGGSTSSYVLHHAKCNIFEVHLD